MTQSIVVYQEGLNTTYELDNLYEVFFLKNNIIYTQSRDMLYDKVNSGYTGIEVSQAESIIDIQFFHQDTVVTRRVLPVEGHGKVELKRAVYELLSRHFTPNSKWGILVGIRPVKIVHEMLDEGKAMSSIQKDLRDIYHIHPDKVELMTEIALKERPYLLPNDPNAISLYICIPFCPTRCLYCSFPSNDLKSKGKRLPEYLEKLNIEIEHAVNHIKSLHKTVDCIYIGGGTPTSIDENQLENLLMNIKKNVDLSKVKEYTVEAGRPDTITLKKLELLKQHGVDRICINPQTMNEETLIRIGRRHSADSIIDIMDLANQVGFKSINMDIILGLPGESLKDAEQTIQSLIQLNPENITVHTLAVKKASRLHDEMASYELAHDAVVEDMLTYTDQILRQSIYSPYYMYRQKKMIGHLENVGYSKIGYESLYNMRIMEEKHSIVACGAGAVSKICEATENRFDRIANFKGLEDYLDRFDEILIKKTLLK